MTISNEHYQAIGKISVAFGQLESNVSFFIWQLIGAEQHVGQMVTAKMSFSRQVDLLSSLFRHRCDDSAKRDEFKRWIVQLSKLEEQRNAILHSLWDRQSKDAREATRFKITLNRKQGLSHSKEVIKPEQLEEIANDFQKTFSEFFTFITTYLINKAH